MSYGSIVFLMYHELESPGHHLCQSEAGYIRYVRPHLRFPLADGASAATGIGGVSVGVTVHPFAQKTVTITFDDSCETDLLHAAPRLRVVSTPM